MTFTSNSAKNGGAINNASTGTLTLTNSTFSSNAATTNAGAINNTGTGALTVTDTAFTSNTCASHGGAVRLYSAEGAAPASFTGCTFTGNAAGGNGGAIYTANYSVAGLTGVTFDGNTSQNGTDNAFYGAGHSQTTIDGITLYVPCSTEPIVCSSTNVKLTIYRDKAYDQDGNALDITGYVRGGTVTYQ